MATDSSAVLRTVSALLDAEPEVAESFLMAAVYVRAIRSGEAPRSVVEQLFRAMPSDESWPALRVALEGIDDGGGGDV